MRASLRVHAATVGCSPEASAGSILGTASKMPGSSYSLPASACKTGQRLARIPGSVCASCYADRGNYLFPSVQAALHRRLASLESVGWEDAMVALIRAEETSGYFRWHPSGDIQSLAHLERIDRIARALPEIRFWLPTREYGIVRAYLRAHAAFAPNLCVRISAPMIDGPAPIILDGRGKPLPRGYVHSGATVPPKGSRARICPAPQQGNACGDCRACWDKRVGAVSYHLH